LSPKQVDPHKIAKLSWNTPNTGSMSFLLSFMSLGKLCTLPTFRFDCANSKAIPRRLDYYYDGEGFAVYFEVETLDGTVIPAGKFDMDDGENKGEEDKPNAEKEGKPEEDANIPPSDGAAVDDDKRVDMQQEGKDKSLDNIDSLQLGIFSFPLNSLTKS
jgi:hypothetical protein